jgi:hypothetical protein
MRGGFGIMMDAIRSGLFTIHGVVVTIIHDLILLGLLAGWIFLQVQVMGNDVAIGVGTAKSARK